jgi:hypothetical protein
MRFRKLRIAWSVGWGVAAVALIALWVRSYTWFDLVILSPNYGMVSEWGGIDMTPVLIPPGPVLNRLVSMRGGKGSYARLDYSLVGFGYSHTPTLPRIGIPYWFPFLLLVALAALPWLGVPARFTTRTLLIATTLVAAALGLIVAVLRWPAG